MKLKRVARLQSGDAITSELIREAGHFPVYGGNGLRGYAEAFTHDGFFPLIGRQGALCGNINYARGRFWASEHAVVAEPSLGVHPRWLGELLRCMNLNQYSVSAAQPGLAVEKIGDLYVPVPSKGEQKSIADFINDETAKIDALVAVQKRLIEVLKEKRQAIISHAVTKGLDPNVPMKDSGMEWLGEVPAHWQVAAIKHALETAIADGPHETPNFLDDGVPFISAEAVSTGIIDFEKAKFVAQSDHDRYCRKCKPQLGDIFVVKSGATTGRSAKVESQIEFSIWSPLALLRCDKDNEADYVLFAIRSNGFQTAVELYWNFGTQQNIAMGTLENLRMPRPPLAEQQLIAAYLLKEDSQLSALEKQADRVIALLAERRTALISAAVTGKIDVRDWRPADYGSDKAKPLPMAAEERAGYERR